MKQLLIPIDGSECSIQAVTAIKQIFPPSHAMSRLFNRTRGC
jgi:hypothetical protein